MKVRILSTSDVHGYVYPTDYLTVHNYSPLGYLKAATIIRKIKKQCNNDGDICIYIENGDFIEGSPLVDYAHRTCHENNYSDYLVQMINSLHADVGILGNHEFNYGLKYLNKVLSNRNYPILGANISNLENYNIIDNPYIILNIKGIKIGILGLTTSYVPHWENPENIPGLKFESAFCTAKKYVPILRNKSDIVIVAYHGGFERNLTTGNAIEPLNGEDEGYKILKQVRGIDAFVTGHQHREIAKVIKSIPITQPGCNAQKVGCITLNFNTDTKRIVDMKSELIDTGKFNDDVYIKKLTSDWNNDTEKWLDNVLSNVVGDMAIHDPMKSRLHGDAYLNFVNQVEMDKMNVDIASTSLFRDSFHGYKNTVTIRDVFNGYNYPNSIVVDQISGLDLKKALEKCASFFSLNDSGQIKINDRYLIPKPRLYNYDYYSGIDYTFDLSKPYGNRVVRLRYHNMDINDDDLLNVAMSQYRGIGGGEYEMFNDHKIISQSNDIMPQILIDYLKKHPIIDAIQPNNLKIIM